MKIVQLSRGLVAKVDDEDFDRINLTKWHAQLHGRTFYGCRTFYDNGRKQNVLLHRFILQPPRDLYVDHIDHDGLNNRRSNLRLCTVSQGLCNRRTFRNSRSGFKGVSFHKPTAKWIVHIQLHGKIKHIGLYETAEEAARAYDKAARELHGEFACLNFPEAPPPQEEPCLFR